MPPMWKEELEDLQQLWKWKFNNDLYLKCALTHFSRFDSHTIHEFPAHRIANRSLEFLGDSILGMCVASHLFQTNPFVQEGTSYTLS